jgi:hypothetical protein
VYQKSRIYPASRVIGQPLERELARRVVHQQPLSFLEFQVFHKLIGNFDLKNIVLDLPDALRRSRENFTADGYRYSHQPSVANSFERPLDSNDAAPPPEKDQPMTDIANQAPHDVL